MHRPSASPLDVAEDRDPRIDGRAHLDLSGDDVADAAQADVAEGVLLARLGDQAGVLGPGPLGHDDDAEHLAALAAALDLGADLVEVEGELGDEDDVGPAGEAALDGDPAGVAAHDLDDHDPVMGLGRRVQAVEGLGDDRDGRVEA
jgi:hypothetical protein